MADFNKSLPLTLRNEGGFYHDPVTGEIVNAGITASTLSSLHLLPSAVEAAYQCYLKGPDSLTNTNPNYVNALTYLSAYVQSITPSQIASFYLKYYWIPVRGDSILDQTIASAFFDIDVNQGGIARQEMQGAVNDVYPPISTGQPLAIDGVIGPQTLVRMNLTLPKLLLPAFQKRVEARYRQIAFANPKLALKLDGWLARLYSWMV